MQVRIVTDAPESVRAGAIVLPVFLDERAGGTVGSIDAKLGGALDDVIASGEFKGKPFELAFVHAKDQPYRRVLLVGLGDRKKFELSMLARYAGTAVRYLGRRNVSDIAIVVPDTTQGRDLAAASFIAEGAMTGTFDTSTYQAKPDKAMSVETVTIVADSAQKDTMQTGVTRGVALAQAVNLARRLALTPANDMTPTILADEASKAAKAANVAVEILEEARARELGMGSFLSVAQGSAQPPKMIVMTYEGDPGAKEKLALVGKGITFDTGGISLKPPDRMEEMKYDMSGGAAVIATMACLGTLKPKINVIGIVPATENMPGGKATKPGDIVKAMNGTTIEVINTDAEGRLILADALCYAKKLGATKIVDCATLTGACVIALGHAASAAVGNDDAFMSQFQSAAKETGERYWPMPAYDEYAQAMKSDIADLKNTGGRAAGTLTAAAFLKSFVDDTPWIHLDIAGTAYLDNESAWQAKGPTGTPVRALVSLAETLAGAPVVHENGSARVHA